MGRGALWRDNQQSTFAHIHTSASHLTISPWSPIPYPHYVSTRDRPKFSKKTAHPAWRPLLNPSGWPQMEGHSPRYHNSAIARVGNRH